MLTKAGFGLIKTGNSYVHMTSKILLMQTFHLFSEYIRTVDSIHFHVPLTLLLLAQDHVLYNSETLG